MSDTNTPRTDEAAYRVWGIENVNASLSRTLETELASANARIAELEKESRDVPLCADHAEAWFCHRNFKPGDCWFCELSNQILSLTRQLSEAQAQLATSQRQSRASSTAVAKEITKRFFADDLTPERLESLCVALFGPVAAQLTSAREDGERLIDAITSVTDWKGTHVGDVIADIEAARGVISCNRCDGTGVIPAGDLMDLHQTGNAEFGEVPCPDCAAPSPPASAEPGPASTKAEDECPQCGEDLCRDEVDIGIGIQCGPWFCQECGWSQARSADEILNSFDLVPPPPTQGGKEGK